MKAKIIKIGTFEWINGAAKVARWEFDYMGKAAMLDLSAMSDISNIEAGDDGARLPAGVKLAGWTMQELDAIANGTTSKGKIIAIGKIALADENPMAFGWGFDCQGQDIVGVDYARNTMAGWTMQELDAIANGSA